MRTLIYIAAVVAAFSISSCRSPQRLIDKAIKKNPKIINQYSDTIHVYTDSIDTVYTDPVIQIDESPGILDKLLENRRYIKEKKLEHRNERQKVRQENKTQRKKVKQDGKTERKETKQEGKTARVSERQDNRTERQGKRQDEKTNRSGGWWLFFVLFAFILGLITSRVLANRMNWRNKV